MIIFLSYKYEDKSYADGMDGFLNNPNNKYRNLTEREEKDLRPRGENVWKNYLKDKIRRCNALICLIGNNTHNAQGVIYELEVANSLKKRIIPVRIPDTTGAAPQIIKKRKIISYNAREINNELSKKKS
ncbi:MAG: toll/interleukin-1 receptor domain-containing protein [Candidatus Lokiarchaeota archaeon]|nr:toll/interleukin-1 receptor domain-containing protein [Candidatus Lokiarchaeota archaeon]